MDVVSRTTMPPLDSSADLAACVRDLAAQSAIRDLAALYAVAVDDHDLAGVLACFAPDGSFTRAGVRSTGTEELTAFYRKMMGRYRTMLHVTHSHVVQVRGDHATGLLSGHAELALDDTLMVTAYRYDDSYALVDGRWVFTDRGLCSMYVVPVDELALSFRDDQRIRWPGMEPRTADYPETASTWDTYEASRREERRP